MLTVLKLLQSIAFGCFGNGINVDSIISISHFPLSYTSLNSFCSRSKPLLPRFLIVSTGISHFQSLRPSSLYSLLSLFHLFQFYYHQFAIEIYRFLQSFIVTIHFFNRFSPSFNNLIFFNHDVSFFIL